MKIAAATGALLAGLASGLCGCGEPSPEPYIEQLKSTHSDEREEAAYDLLRLGAAVVPRLLEEVDAPSSRVRYIVVQLLGRLRDQRAVPVLVAALDDRSAAVAGKAAWSLAELRSPEALPALLDMAGHPTAERRRQAVRALGFCHSYDWEPVLSAGALEKVFAALADSVPEVRIAALQSMRQFGYRRAAAEVVRMSRDPAPEVRYVAVQALGQIVAGVAPGAEVLSEGRRKEIIAALVAALDEDQYQSIRTESIRALASSGDFRGRCAPGAGAAGGDEGGRQRSEVGPAPPARGRGGEWTMTGILKVGFPSGSLEESTLDLFRRAGYKVAVAPRSYAPRIDDPELRGLMFRAQEIAQYVERGVVDVGLTGNDWILESGADVVVVEELVYSKSTSRPVRWVLAVPEDSPVRTVEDLQGKRIATELVDATRRFLQGRGVEAEVEFSWGTTEAKPGISGLVDAIVELTETGSSLRANRLRVVETLFESATCFIANKAVWEDGWKREKAENLLLLLKGALEAEPKVGLKMNVPRRKLEAVIARLPALHTPTISNQLDESWVALEIIADEAVVRQLIPQLKKVGATGIIEYPLNKVVY